MINELRIYEETELGKAISLVITNDNDDRSGCIHCGIIYREQRREALFNLYLPISLIEKGDNSPYIKTISKRSVKSGYYREGSFNINRLREIKREDYLKYILEISKCLSNLYSNAEAIKYVALTEEYFNRYMFQLE